MIEIVRHTRSLCRQVSSLRGLLVPPQIAVFVLAHHRGRREGAAFRISIEVTHDDYIIVKGKATQHCIHIIHTFFEDVSTPHVSWQINRMKANWAVCSNKPDTYSCVSGEISQLLDKRL